MLKLKRGPKTWAISQDDKLPIGTLVEQDDHGIVFYPAANVFLDVDDLRWLADAIQGARQASYLDLQGVDNEGSGA